jgi:leader peptidase (prepilin peptidase) / N-methyltransferase
MAISSFVSLVVCGFAVAADLPGTRRWWRVLGGVCALMTAIVAWALVSTPTPSWTATLGWGVVAGVLCVQVVIDLVSRTLPRQVSYAGLVVAAPLLAVSPSPGGGGMAGIVIGAIAMTVIAAGLFMGARGSFGIGDVHLSPLLGMSLGWLNPWLILTAWVVIAVAGGIGITVLLLGRRIRWSSPVPYGPFMVAGTFVAALIGLLGFW